MKNYDAKEDTEKEGYEDTDPEEIKQEKEATEKGN